MFKVGDKVQMDKNKIINILGYLPKWYTEYNYIIIKIYNTFDLQDFQHVELNVELNMSYIQNRITSQYLKPSIRETRKIKLQKIKMFNE